MNTPTYRRISRLAGLLFLSSLVFAMGIQAAQAAVVVSDGGASSTASIAPATQLQGLSAAAVAQHHGTTMVVIPAAGAAGTQGNGGAAGTSLTAVQRRDSVGRGAFQPTANVAAAQPASSTGSSGSAWIIAGSAVAIVLVGFAAWAIAGLPAAARQRYCAQHPEDAMCAAA